MNMKGRADVAAAVEQDQVVEDDIDVGLLLAGLVLPQWGYWWRIRKRAEQLLARPV